MKEVIDNDGHLMGHPVPDGLCFLFWSGCGGRDPGYDTFKEMMEAHAAVGDSRFPVMCPKKSSTGEMGMSSKHTFQMLSLSMTISILYRRGLQAFPLPRLGEPSNAKSSPHIPVRILLSYAVN